MYEEIALQVKVKGNGSILKNASTANLSGGVYVISAYQQTARTTARRTHPSLANSLSRA